MRKLVLDIPDNVNLSDNEAKVFLAIKLFENSIFSLGQASKFSGYTKQAFMEILCKNNVSVINHPVSEIENDFINAKNHSL